MLADQCRERCVQRVCVREVMQRISRSAGAVRFLSASELPLAEVKMPQKPSLSG